MAVVDRIKKLLNLSQSDNVNEAAGAAAEAQRLMQEHKIALADLELAGEKVAPEPLIETALEGAPTCKTHRSPWRFDLACQLAAAFGCKVWFTFGTNHIGIIGHQSNVQTVQYLQGYFALEILRLCERGWAALKAEAGPEVELPRASVWKASFRKGGVHAIGARLQFEKNPPKPAGVALVEPSQALVLVRQTEATQEREVGRRWTERFTGRNGRSTLRSARYRAARHSQDGYSAGKAAGGSIPLNAAKGSLKASATRLEV